MVKSAVKAMDAAQAFAKEKDKPITRFVVTGASKRGWTTWLTGASDPRVKAIAPMVIPTLNLDAQNKHQLENFGGKFSEQIQDYTDRGLIGSESKPNAKELLAMVDPYTYRNRLRLPKFQINGTNDPYWTLDSLNLYWDELVGPKWVVYLPNAGHGLDQHREYAMGAIGALCSGTRYRREAVPEILVEARRQRRDHASRRRLGPRAQVGPGLGGDVGLTRLPQVEMVVHVAGAEAEDDDRQGEPRDREHRLLCRPRVRDRRLSVSPLDSDPPDERPAVSMSAGTNRIAVRFEGDWPSKRGAALQEAPSNAKPISDCTCRIRLCVRKIIAYFA